MRELKKAVQAKWAIYGTLAVVLGLALWIGWGDFDPVIPRAEVQDGIRYVIRRVIQILIQFIIPVSIIGYFVAEAFGSVNKKAGQRKTDG